MERKITIATIEIKAPPYWQPDQPEYAELNLEAELKTSETLTANQHQLLSSLLQVMLMGLAEEQSFEILKDGGGLKAEVDQIVDLEDLEGGA